MPHHLARTQPLLGLGTLRLTELASCRQPQVLSEDMCQPPYLYAQYELRLGHALSVEYGTYVTSVLFPKLQNRTLLKLLTPAVHIQ